MKIKNYSVKYWTSLDPESIALLSDLHLSSYTTPSKENDIVESLEKINPSHIVIAGGLYDGTDEELFENEAAYKYFLRYLKEVSEIAPIYFTLSGSEIFPANNEHLYKKNVCSFDAYLRFKKFISDLKANEIRCYLLGQQADIATRKDGDITFSGLNIDSSFFTLDSDEARNVLLQYEKYLYLVVKKLNKEKFNVLVLHDPLIFKSVKNIGLLTKFDLVLGGTSRISQASKLQNVRLYPESFKKKYTVGYTNIIACPEEKLGNVRVRKR